MVFPKSIRIRLIPVTILAASFLAGVKLVDVWSGAAPLLLGIAQAQAAATPASASASASTPATPAAASTTGAAGTAAATGATPPPPGVPQTVASEDPVTYSKAEIDVLQGLAKRRDTLDARARALDMRENMLAATARKVDARIAALKALEVKIQALLNQRSAQDEKNLKSLVKVYENMKPEDAARIFEKLDMPILLDVVGRMREQKLAPILADMNPDKARSVTTELATRRATPLDPGQSAAADSAGKSG